MNKITFINEGDNCWGVNIDNVFAGSLLPRADGKLEPSPMLIDALGLDRDAVFNDKNDFLNNYR